MSFIAVCPHCQAKFTAQDHLAGKNVRCPKCKEPFRIGDVVSQAEKLAKAARQQRRPSDSSHEDLPVAKPAKPKAEPPPQPTAKTPPPAATPARSWKEIAEATQPKPAETPPPQPTAAAPAAAAAAPVAAAPAAPVAAPPHATPPPDQPIVLNPTITAAWEALPPIILTTARHEAVELSAGAVAPAPPPQVERPAAPPSSHAMMFDDDLDDSCLDGPADSAPAFSSAAATYARPASPVPPPAPPRPAPQPPAPPKPPEKPPEEDEVIELGFEDLVVERMDEEEVVELSDNDFIDEAPPSKSNSSAEIITEVEVIEDAPRRSSGSLSANPGPPPVKPTPTTAASENDPSAAKDDKRQFMTLLIGGGGGLAAVLVLIALLVTLSGGSNKFEPSESFQPTTGSIRFFDPSGKISIQFPQPFADLPPERRDDVTVRGANLIGKQEKFAIYYSDAIPVAKPPSGAKPVREHWLPFNLPELAGENPYVTSIRRRMIGGNYAVEYQLAQDIVRNQPGETRVLLIFIQQRMFVVLWAGDHYRDDVDDFFASFTIDGEKFGDQ